MARAELLEDAKPAPQSMNDLPESEQHRALLAIAHFAVLKRDGRADDDIATKLGFGSAEAMYTQFRNWGLPDWMLGGVPAEEQRRRRARRSRGGDGASSQLPSAGDATELFLHALKKLEDDAGNLKQRKEFLQEKRFVAKRRVPLTPVHRQDELPEQVWREICARHDKDPATTEVVEEDPIWIEVPAGGSATPLEPLPALIAVYTLSGEPLEALVDKLHPLPEDTDREALVSALANIKDRLELAAAQLAKAVRGGEVKQGPPKADLSWTEIWAAKQIREGRRRGQTDEEIHSFLRTHPDLAGLSTEEFSRFANLPVP